jgi:putative redox protein
MGSVEVRYEGGDRFSLDIRGHRLLVDQTVDEGGEDAGPTPTELFVAGLATCVGFYAERFLRRHGLPAHDVHVRTSFEFAKDRPARVGSVDIRVFVPAGLTTKQVEALTAVIDHCTVHNSLRQPPEVRILLGEPEAMAHHEMAAALAAGGPW